MLLDGHDHSSTLPIFKVKRFLKRGLMSSYKKNGHSQKTICLCTYIQRVIKNYRFKKLSKQLNMDKVPKFTQIRLETSNICHYNCFMCPRKKMTRKVGTMSINDLNYVLDYFDSIKYELDIHIHGFGEAFICDDLPLRCKLITTRKPNFTPYITTTLGCNRDKPWLESLFKNGLKKMDVSLYGYDRETYKKVHGVDKFDTVKENLEFISSLRGKYNFTLRVCLDEFGKNYPLPKGYTHTGIKTLKTDFTKYLNRLGITNIICLPLHNFGSGFKNMGKNPKTVPCSVVWGNRRRHIAISWDLNVSPCSYDYDCSVVWGNLRENSLEEIYKSPKRIEFIKSILEQKSELCSGNSCHPDETQYDQEYKIIKEFMAKNH